MGAISLKQVHKFFDALEVIKGVDLEINEGEFVVFVGPSGCGKSTMLRLIAGLEEVTAGAIEIDGKDVTAIGASERGLAMVFQSYALYPHMSVAENMAFGLKLAGSDKSVVAAAVQGAAEALQITPLLERKPKALSGGQRQRVAIGRAIVREPEAFLFDEPLSNLDASLRVLMRIEISKLHQQLKKTMIYVTHDQVEAMTLADRIVVFNAGHIQQQGSPLSLYTNPNNLFVAKFIGSPNMNVFECAPTDHPQKISLRNGNVITTQAMEYTGEAAVHFGIRPEHIDIINDNNSDVRGCVSVVEHLGSETFVYVEVDSIGMITLRVNDIADVAVGETIGLKFNPKKAHLFDAKALAITRHILIEPKRSTST